MKKILLLILIISGLSFNPFNSFCQVPQAINYQGVARDNSGNILANQPAGLQISLHSGSVTGPIVYQETHAVTTNAYGLFTIQIGGGTIVSGTFNSIGWGTTTWFVQVEMDATGGVNYQDMGTSQLLSVPYALYAETSSSSIPGPQGPAGPQGPQGIQGMSGTGSCDIIKSGDGRIVVYTATKGFGFGASTNGYSAWYPITFSGEVQGAIAGDSCIVVYTSTNAYAFGTSTNGYSAWHSLTLTGTVTGAVAASGKIVIYTADKAYGFGPSTNDYAAWYTLTLAEPALGHMNAQNRIVVFTSAHAYGFGPSTNGYSAWYSTTLDASPIDIIGTK